MIPAFLKCLPKFSSTAIVSYSSIITGHNFLHAPFLFFSSSPSSEIMESKQHIQTPENTSSSCSDVHVTKKHASHPLPISAQNVQVQTQSQYPTSFFRSFVAGREKRKLGDQFRLSNFGVNHTTLAPGASSALPHSHSMQDEFIYVLSGTAICRLYMDKQAVDGSDSDLTMAPSSATMADESVEYTMGPGDCIGFPKATGVSHCIRNPSDTEPLIYLEVGDRSPNDVVTYGRGIDLKAEYRDGQYIFLHKDGSPYGCSD